MTGTVLCPRCSRLPRPTVNCSKCKQWRQRAEAKRPPTKEKPMKTLVYAGVTYHCPLSPKYRRHNPGERERMASSGDIEYPVLIYRDKTLGLSNCILDGEGRLETAIENGNIIEFKKVREMTTDEAFERSKALNDARRHDDMAAIQKRRERVSEARAEGKSLQTIADEEGVSKATVRRDLETDSPGVPPGTPGPKPTIPEIITGVDGKQYHQAPKVTPAPYTDRELRRKRIIELMETTHPEMVRAIRSGELILDDEQLEASAPLSCKKCWADGPPKGAACVACARLRKPKGFTGPDPGTTLDSEPFAELRRLITQVSGDITKAVNDKNSEFGRRLHDYMAVCGLLDHPPEKHGAAVFLPLKGVALILEWASKEGPRRTDADVKEAYDTASGGWIPPVTKRRRAARGKT